MDCPTEETLIRNKLGGMAGIAALEFNLIQRVLTVHHTLPSAEPVARAIESLGMRPVPLGAEAAQQVLPEIAGRKPWWPLAMAGVAALGAEATEWLGLGLPWLPAVLALAAVALGGLTTYRKGWIALRNANLNINALMSIAVTGALLLRQWPEAAMVMVLFALAERIEAASLDRARNAIRGLMAMAPEQATVRRADGSWETVPAAGVAVGTLVRLRPGERVALDGKVVRGKSALDQAPITGESVPVDKAEGDALYAGSINQSGELEYTVTAPASDSTLARIIHAVEAAQGSRAPTQRFVDQFARIYTPTVFAIALAVAVVPPLVAGGGWVDWIYKALVLLVIACPCALVISTPVTIVSGLAAAARRGILVKGGVYLEQGRELAWVALDKTGTITHGKPAQTDHALLADDVPHARAIAASLAARSDHPVSRAVAAAARADGIDTLPVEAFEALAGRGTRGTVRGVEYRLGNHRLVHEMGACSPALEARLEALEREGKTVVLLARVNDQGAATALALFAVADTVRDTSRQAIAELHALGVKTLMLSGDNPHTAQAIAAQVGIDEARGNQLPQGKADAIAALAGAAHARGGRIGMVGDGINDAPALARADVGFAMGAAGTDTAIETADVALMDDDLRKIPAFVRLSRRTATILRQNIALALGIKAVFLVLTVLGMGTMWMAVFADMGASLLVVFNGLRVGARRGGGSLLTVCSPPASGRGSTP
ncbi:putative Cation (cadmium)-transporting ATPase (Cadmium efflux ATPase) (plasmid) [Cupriavidus taiwanensis]|uniref:P-type Zn(2+) transporter n=2 Tax=Cupriavidus taiwanensis TaxID=164546 RepID=A0A7Z7JDL3_9BURK|nr:cation (putative cadmium)-transporting ATPase (Cadmium efflux ATPase) [Cupriavidus taiwanensis]SOZ12990.1 cation (putative cadmium)-transporting ATPase (Cadmium efflux ATPase) [Cupriavidus taiwanensis]SOZ41486.1 cation (putative cadmium)-transporting ATPase (Cadmium efflux ATPase) [Cupriavidus taiwanensis]SPC20899.1 cation (putative cadmium)-transporting ATPase (Cadmium efflux ATPase) [Cupriavidus taiwanensis]SPD55041.1 putative Cation (cadmium)-transporting ATPase (Cadmium efflux ATPase) [C